MAHITRPMIMEHSTTTGTGNFTLAGARAPGSTFSTVCATSDTFYYCIRAVGGLSEWEEGLATLVNSTTFSRSVVFSSNSNNLVNFSAGPKHVDLVWAAARIALLAGDGIQETSTGGLGVDVSDFAGAGLEDDGSENLRIAAAAAGAGLTGGAGSALAVGAGTHITVNADDVAVNTSTLLAAIDSTSIVVNSGTLERAAVTGVIAISQNSPTSTFDASAAATSSFAGVSELATTTETITGTDSARTVTPDGLAALWEAGTDNTGGATITMGEGGSFNLITSTTAITAFAFTTDKAGRTATIRFNTARVLTHNSTSLVIPGGANIATVQGDVCQIESLGSGNFRVNWYQRVDGGLLTNKATNIQSAIALASGSNTAVAVQAGANEVLLDCSAGSATVHGLLVAGGNTGTWFLLRRTNAGVNTITIPHNSSTDGTATNRFRTPNQADIILTQVNSCVWVKHDGSLFSVVLPSPLTRAATIAETLTGTDFQTAVTPDGLAALWEAGTDNTGGATITLGNGGSYNLITSTTAITALAFTTDKAGRTATLRFNTIRTLTHNGTSLILPTAANITTAVGDICQVESLGSGNFRVNYYQRASGTPLVSASAASTSAAGISELATTTETITGTDTARAVTPASLAALWEAGTNNADGATITLGEGGYFNIITSTATITSIVLTTDKSGRRVMLRFLTTRQITHNGTSLQLPNNSNITTAAGDIADVVSLGGGNVRFNAYYRINGKPLFSPTVDEAILAGSNASVQDVSWSGTHTYTSNHIFNGGKWLPYVAEQSVSGSGPLDITLDATTNRLTLTGTSVNLKSVTGGTDTGRSILVVFTGSGTHTAQHQGNGVGNEANMFFPSEVNTTFRQRGSFMLQANGTVGWRAYALSGESLAGTGLAINATAGLDVSYANQATMETGTSTTTAVNPANQHFHDSAAKFWCVWANTTTILDSFNVSTITDSNVGDQTVNLTTAFSSANWVPVNMSHGPVPSTTVCTYTMCCAKAAGTVDVDTFDIEKAVGTAAPRLDPTQCCVAGFGDR